MYSCTLLETKKNVEPLYALCRTIQQSVCISHRAPIKPPKFFNPFHIFILVPIFPLDGQSNNGSRSSAQVPFQVLMDALQTFQASCGTEFSQRGLGFPQGLSHFNLEEQQFIYKPILDCQTPHPTTKSKPINHGNPSF